MYNVTLTFPDAADERFKAMVAKTKADNPAEVVGNALRLYEEMIKRKEENRLLYERNDAGEYVEYRVFQEMK